jgi:hypothetical protein
MSTLLFDKSCIYMSRYLVSSRISDTENPRIQGKTEGLICYKLDIHRLYVLYPTHNIRVSLKCNLVEDIPSLDSAVLETINNLITF